MGRGKNALRITFLHKAVELIDFLSEFIQSKSNNQNPTDKKPQLTRLLEYLEQHYTEKITNKEIREYMNMSESTLNRFLKKETGRSLIVLVHHIRIHHAIDLLRATSDKIGSIGYSVGFESPSDFCCIFKKEMGMTPLEFREKTTL